MIVKDGPGTIGGVVDGTCTLRVFDQQTFYWFWNLVGLWNKFEISPFFKILWIFPLAKGLSQ